MTSHPILVTGAAGHLGIHIVRELLASGQQVRALVRQDSQKEKFARFGLDLDKIEVVVGDLTQPGIAARVVAGCEMVYHAAAVFRTRGVDEEAMVRENRESTRAMIEACLANGVKRVVYTSSVASLGPSRRSEEIRDERHFNDDPIDGYVRSKCEAEKMVREAYEQRKLPVVIVNPATILGPGDFKPTPSNWFLLETMKKVPKAYFNGGHSYCDVEDVARGHVAAMARGRLGERYVLAGDNIAIRDFFIRVGALRGGGRPLFRIGHAVVEVAGLLLETKAKLTGGTPFFTRRKAHKLIDYYGYYSSEKANRELGYQSRSFDLMIQRSAAWFEKMGWLPVAAD